MNNTISELYQKALPDFAPRAPVILSRSEVFNTENAELIAAIQEGRTLNETERGRLFFNCIELVHLLTMHEVFNEHPDALQAMKDMCVELSDGFMRRSLNDV